MLLDRQCHDVPLGNFFTLPDIKPSLGSKWVFTMKSNAATSDRVGMYYRSLSEAENQTIYRIKEQGQEFLELIDELGESDETRRAKARIEEAVMWAVKHITR